VPILLVELVDTCYLIDTVSHNLALVGDDVSRLTIALDRTSLFVRCLSTTSSPQLIFFRTTSFQISMGKISARFFALGARLAQVPRMYWLNTPCSKRALAVGPSLISPINSKSHLVLNLSNSLAR
jgi:hypothetical protein